MGVGNGAGVLTDPSFMRAELPRSDDLRDRLGEVAEDLVVRDELATGCRDALRLGLYIAVEGVERTQIARGVVAVVVSIVAVEIDEGVAHVFDHDAGVVDREPDVGIIAVAFVLLVVLFLVVVVTAFAQGTAIGDGYDRCVGVLQSVVEEIVEAEAVAQNEAGAGDVAQLAGLEIKVVRILIWFQEDGEVDAVTAYVHREVPYLSRDRDYVWLLRVTIASAAGSEQQGQKREREEEEFHVHHLVETNSHLQMRCYLS